jgi:hypothetical protein
MYEASTPEVLDTAGKGEKSPIFFGKKLFVDPAFKSFTKDDYKLIIMHEHRHARQHALGYDGVDMPELIKNFRNGSIDSKVFWAASELDANAEELRLIRTGYPASAALLDNLFENICMDLTPSTPGFVMSSVSRQFYETVLSNNRPILNVYASEIAQKRIELEKKRKK